jgi:hypothetical protein
MPASGRSCSIAPHALLRRANELTPTGLAGKLRRCGLDEDTGGYAAGRLVLEADGASGSCHRTSEIPDLRIAQRTLASIYVGGFTLAQLASPAGWPS